MWTSGGLGSALQAIWSHLQVFLQSERIAEDENKKLGLWETSMRKRVVSRSQSHSYRVTGNQCQDWKHNPKKYWFSLPLTWCMLTVCAGAFVPEGQLRAHRSAYTHTQQQTNNTITNSNSNLHICIYPGNLERGVIIKEGLLPVQLRFGNMNKYL